MSKASTPVADGFAMPPEWAPHARCYISWPCREDLWTGYLEKVKTSYAEVAKAINRFEPITMLTPPSAVSEARVHLDPDIEIFEVDLDDSWVRDNGPIFVTSDSGEVALVDFDFNGWGNRYSPYDKDNALPASLAKALGIRYYKAPMVLEGGSFYVDGEGTLLTTESCLLNPCMHGNIGSSNMVYFTIQTATIDTTSPSISIVSPENKTYATTDISLTLTVDEIVSWMAYSLDGQANVTITGNTTLSGLSDGSHNLIVYAKDAAGNTGASEMVYFSIDTLQPEPFPWWILGAIAGIVVIGIALGTFFLRRKRPVKS